MLRVDRSAELVARVRERIDAWQAGQRPDASQALSDYPELAASKSLVLDLVLAEYRLRNATGDGVTKGEYYERFPAYRQSIGRLLEVQDFLDRCPEFAAAEEPRRWPAVGDELLGFEIVEPLGCGGIARVFLARELEVGERLVVIKVAPCGGCEAERLGKLAHPNIMPIHSVKHDPAGGWTVICMPLLGVATAVDVLDRAFAHGAVPTSSALIGEVARQTRPLAAIPEPAFAAAAHQRRVTYSEAVAQIGWQLAEALAAAHAAGIVHRDIKPSNILFDWSGRPLLLDFNLSTADEPAAQRLGGTPAYMAPERIASLLAEDGAAASRFHPQCDLYSLGAVLYELLSGQLPAHPTGLESTGRPDLPTWLAAKQRPAPPLPMGGQAVDRRLDALVRRCLEVEPARRFASAAALAAELRDYLGRGPRAIRAARRHRREFLLGGLGLAAAGSVLVAYVESRPTPQQRHFQHAVAKYEQGEYEAAVASFTRCLEMQPGWPDAQFGRAQSLRQLENWSQAQTDFLALDRVDAGWAFALAGYCSLRAQKYQDAFIKYEAAFRAGLRDSGALFNYAHVARLRQQFPREIEIYDELLAVQPQNKAALASRALAYAALSLRSQSVPPRRALDDAEAFCQLEPDSFRGAYVAAVVYGTAALRAPQFEDEAIRRLTAALQRGMPVNAVGQFSLPLKRLLPYLDAEVLAATHAEERQDGFDPWAVHSPPLTAQWSVFRRAASRDVQLLARLP